MSTKSPRVTAIVAAALAVALWGTSFVATKTALRELSPISLIFIRFLIGWILLFLIAAHRGVLRPPDRDAVPSLLLMGFVGVFFHQMVQVWGLTMTTATNTGWLTGLVPIWSAILAFVFYGERFGFRRLSGLLFGFFGAVIIITKGIPTTDFFGLPSTRGDLLILASTVNWAVYTLIGRATIQRLGALRATAWAMLFGWLMIAGLFVATRAWTRLHGLSGETWGAVAFLGIGCSGLAYLLWTMALERETPSRVASLLYFEPFVTLVAAMILLDERFITSTAIGGIVVFAGVWMLHTHDARTSDQGPVPERQRRGRG